MTTADHDFASIDELLDWACADPPRSRSWWSAPAGPGITAAISPWGEVHTWVPQVSAYSVDHGPTLSVSSDDRRHSVPVDLVDLADRAALEARIAAAVERVRIEQDASAPEVMRQLGEAARRFEQLCADTRSAQAERDRLIVAARADGIPAAAVAERARVAYSRVYQIAPGAR
ncbi:hypothetical protein [Pseudonocardia asaccharolytica]|uniref:Uncharacterized protein n=1 Tax=Pseudonocardia asaccharolytica DSM 44247 = NBRC 16224 TaxID=1123024 RepID=A0A511D3G0_9PSEU|nr:hypothetical protein [Pseudonocardia asaccharolytica]GEL19326.1 hypothetical protein PA7_31630 [Pseudonocardia asaccharolytica DSM 44247 = NBRC 16224]